MKLKQGISLYPYQHEVVEWMNDIKNQKINGSNGGVLFMDMGLGKTFTTLEYLRQITSKININRELKSFVPDILADIISDYSYTHAPNLVICSKTLINEWVNQMDKFYDVQPRYLILHNNYNKITNISTSDLYQYDIIFTTYHMVARANRIVHKSEEYIFKEIDGRVQRYVIRENNNSFFSNNLSGIASIFGLKWDNIICDECQTLTNWKTTFFKSIYSLAANYKFGLSGTPIKNNKNELIALLKFMNVRGFNTMRGWNKAIIPKETFNLFKYVDYKMAKITLPDTFYNEIKINMNKDNTKIYAKYVEELWDLYKISRNKSEDNNIMAIMGLFTRLRQICLDPYLLTLKKKSLEQYKQTMGIETEETDLLFNNQKLVEIKKIIKSKTDEKLIIFSAFTSYLIKLSDNLIDDNIPNTIILASDSIKNRHKKIELWKQSKTDNILIMNYVIGAEGLNLIEANNVILLDTWWNFSLEKQAIARVKRIGQTRNINVFRLLMKNTIEDIILEKSQSKVGLFEKLRDDEAIEIVTLSQENIGKLLVVLKRNIRKANETHKVKPIDSQNSKKTIKKPIKKPKKPIKKTKKPIKKPIKKTKKPIKKSINKTKKPFIRRIRAMFFS